MPAFVEHNGYPVGRGDFVIVSRVEMGHQLARVSRWINKDWCTAYVYSWQRGWSKRPKRINRGVFVEKLHRPGEWASIVSGAPKVKA